MGGGSSNKISDRFKNVGNDAMVTGGSIAALGLLDGPIPDGEVVGAAIFLGGAADYAIGRILELFGW